LEEMAVHLQVNGREVTAQVAPELSLLDFLRQHLRLTGTKNGCHQGHCGTCTVIVDGKATLSCLLPMSKANGRRIETIEGLCSDGQLHPLQQAFLESGAVQCGFCTPGMVMAAKALLDRNPHPSQADIQRALSPNLCRCTGYVKVIEAVQQAARMMAEGREGDKGVFRPDHEVIGRSVEKKDAVAKVTGEARYTDDLFMESMLHGKVLWSPYPHAEILSIGTHVAERLPGVRAVLTARDVKGSNRFGAIMPDQPVLVETRARFIGDAIALVCADTEEAAQAALEAIKVEYRELEGIFSPERALEPDAPMIHEGGNILTDLTIRSGDVDRGFGEADVIVEESYYTPCVEHAFMEPEAAVAVASEDGGVTVWTGVQNPFDVQRQIANALGLVEERVTVVNLAVGGAFGGKCDVSLQILAALGALHTRRPVKMVFTRQESLCVHPKRHAFYMRYKSGASKGGKLTAVKAEITSDAGAYASWSPVVMKVLAGFACGPYEVPNVELTLRAVYTNNVSAGAWRGFGVPQAHFAAELQMDLLARQLGMDPFEFRERNAQRAGSVTHMGQILEHSVGLRQTLAAAKRALGKRPASRVGKKIGVGLASGFKSVGLPVSMQDRAGAVVEVTEEGGLLVRVGCADIGQGSDTTMAQIAAQAVGLSYDRVKILPVDTLHTPEAGPTIASRQTYVSGNAVLGASRKLREHLWTLVAQEFGLDPARIILENDCFIDLEAERALISMADLAALAQSKGEKLSAEHRFVDEKGSRTADIPGCDFGGYPKEDFHYTSYAYATQVAVVEVDENTGKVDVLKIVAAHDVGRAIHPQNIEGQIEGSCLMGLGTALWEEFRVEQGRNLTDTLARCHIPRITQIPEIVPIIVEDEEPAGPYGAKGIAEIAAIPTAPAIINAIHDAVGARITELPATKEKVLLALRQRLEAG
jgi:aldehyde oxidoreductase